MVISTLQTWTTPDRPAIAEAVFSCPDVEVVTMARKHRSASTRQIGVPRHPNGRIYHKKSKADELPPKPYAALAQRLRHHDPANAEILLIAAVTPDRKLSRRVPREMLMKAIKAAEDPRLGYALGILWACGLLCPAPDGFETADEKDARAEEAELLDKSGRLYAAQHYLVWRWQGSPCQGAPSHLETLLAEVVIDGARPMTELDPEEFEAIRVSLKRKLEAARRALIRAAPMGLALQAVDRICIDGFDGEIHPSALKHLLTGLRTLREHYDVRLEKSRDRYAGHHPPPPPTAQAATPQRNRRTHQPANLTSDPALRPPPRRVAESVARLLGAPDDAAPA